MTVRFDDKLRTKSTNELRSDDKLRTKSTDEFYSSIMTNIA